MDPATLAKIQAMPDGPLKDQFLRYVAMQAGPPAGSAPTPIADAIAGAMPSPTLSNATPLGAQGIAGAVYSPQPAHAPLPSAPLSAASQGQTANPNAAPSLGAAAAAVPLMGVPAVAGMYAASKANEGEARIQAGKDNALEQMPHKAGNFSAAPRAVVGAMPEGPPRGTPQFVADIDKLQAQGAIGADTAASMKAKLAADEKARADRKAELEGKQFAADTNSKWHAERPDLAAKAGKVSAMTATPQVDEAAFQKWYGANAKKFGIDQNPDAPEHKYDYRAAFKAGQGPDATGHWPSAYKAPDHPRRFLPVNGVMTDTITMQPVSGATSTKDAPVGQSPAQPAAPEGSWAHAVGNAFRFGGA